MSGRLERLWYPATPEGPVQQVLRSPLLLPMAGFAGAGALRRALFRRGLKATRTTRHIPVISVGNLTVGGSGKTPAVLELVERLQRRGLRVAVLSRGYGRRSRRVQVLEHGAPSARVEDVGDEPLLIARRCPQALVLVGADRAALARQAEETHGAQIVVLDDGMQHLRLARDLDVVVIDEAVGFGNGYLLPRGPLREPLSELSRAGLFWIRSAPIPVGLSLPDRPTVRAGYLPGEVCVAEGELRTADVLRGRRVWAFAGIARPERFASSLVALGASVERTTSFGDHHAYRPDELAALEAGARAAGLQLVTTEKDAVRLPRGFPAWALRLEVRLQGDAAAVLETALSRLLAEPRPARL